MGIETTNMLRAIAEGKPDLEAVWPKLADVIAMNCMQGFLPQEPELQSEILNEEELLEVKQALMTYLESEPDGDHAASAIWCLGKCFDPDLKAFLVACLQQYYHSAQASLHALGQAQIALSNLDEDVLGGGSFAAHEFEKNMEDVRAYLTRLGKLDP